MTNGVVTLGTQGKNRTPQCRSNGSRTFNDEARQFLKNCIAELVHWLIVVIFIVTATQLPPSLMRPQPRYKLPVRFKFLGRNYVAILIAQQPRKGALQEMSRRLPDSLRPGSSVKRRPSRL